MAFRDASATITLHQAPWMAAVAFFAFLILVFVGLTPFDHNFSAIGEAGEGNIARQVSYLVVFVIIAAAAIGKRGLNSVSAIPITFALLLGWCLLSAIWSVESLVTFRRAALALIVVLSSFFGVATLGPERSLRILRVLLVGILLVNWLSIPFFAQAVHLPGEADPALVGDWRGVFVHKNIAGAISALSVLVFLYFGIKTRRPWDWLFCAASVVFLVMTQSKTSIALLPIALVAYWGFRRASRDVLERQIVLVGLALLFVIGVSVLFVEHGRIAELLSDPRELTGRTAIWQAEVSYIRDHPWLGAGFGSFADTGLHSPIYPYVGAAWIAETAHGHNGYLQLVVTIGTIGFALAIAAIVVQPMAALLRDGNGEIRALLFAVVVFVLLHNLVESDFLEGDGPVWVTFLIALGILRETKRSEATT